MSDEYNYLSTLRDDMATIIGVKSSKVGLERGIGSKDAPFIRLVPVLVKPNGNGVSMRFQAVFGFDTKNRDYDALHSQYFDMADQIIAVAREHQAYWLSTVTDQDTVSNLKTAVIEFEAELCL